MRDALEFEELRKERKELRGREGFYGPRVDYLEKKLIELQRADLNPICPKCRDGKLVIDIPMPDGDYRFIPEAALYKDEEWETFYYPMPLDSMKSASLVIPCSTHCGPNHFGGGSIHIKPASPDYELWIWIMKRHEAYQGLSSKRLNEVREQKDKAEPKR